MYYSRSASLFQVSSTRILLCHVEGIANTTVLVNRLFCEHTASARSDKFGLNEAIVCVSISSPTNESQCDQELAFKPKDVC
jgi:hypothetical protein